MTANHMVVTKQLHARFTAVLESLNRESRSAAARW